MKKLLITGAAGFIGSKVCELLSVRNDLQIIGVDNFDPYYDVNLKRYRWNKLASFSNLERLELDITDNSAIETLFSIHNFDAVINLAAMAGVRFSISHPQKYFNVNAAGFVVLLEAMRKNNSTQLIQASTSSLYAGLKMPFEETLDVRTPISPYAASKLSAEGLAYTYCHLHGFDVTILRYFTVYGPAGRPDMAPYRFTEWCLKGEPIQLFGTGNQSRDFTFVDDIAKGTIAALDQRINGFEIINLGGGGERLTILEMINTIGTLTGKEPDINFLPIAQGDMLHTSASIEKARKLLDWKPLIGTYDGLKRLVDWHLNDIPERRFALHGGSQ